MPSPSSSLEAQSLSSLHIAPTRAATARAVVDEISELVSTKPHAVLGLATGGTMTCVYEEMVRRVEAGELDLTSVTTFNLDEYLGLSPGSPHSFGAYMAQNLFRPAGLDASRTHVPDPVLARADLDAYCEGWERAIALVGGIDLQLLGLGRNGHIAFNEPGTHRDSRTRVVDLDEATRVDAVKRFGELDVVPRAAITMGVATILEARRLRVLAFGQGKSAILHRALTGEVDPQVPATLLRGHPDLEFWVDEDAANGA